MFEELIYKHVVENDRIKKVLASYYDKPAFFYQEAPSDVDEGWAETQFPRCDYTLELQADTERRLAGQLYVNVYVTDDCEYDLLEIQGCVIECLTNLFVSDKEQGTICLIWKSVDDFVMANEKPKAYGTTLSFDAVYFPSQVSFTPDPILGLCTFLKNLIPGAKVIGIDNIGETWIASDDSPAIYARETSKRINAEMSNFYVNWFNESIRVHVISPSINVRMNHIRKIMESLMIKLEFVLDDQSPYLIVDIKFNSTSDQLQVGQIDISGRYGILLQNMDVDPMNNADWR